MPSTSTVRTGRSRYEQVQQFYARQAHALDSGATEDWAATFTVDGEFALAGVGEPTRGRAAIGAAVAQAAARRAASGVEHRTWLGMLTVDEGDDGVIRTHYYATVFALHDGPPTIHQVMVGTDELVEDGDALLVRRRSVRRQPAPAPTAP